ncbi:MAG TPA: protein kinase [Kofleriaceae bacterium]
MADDPSTRDLHGVTAGATMDDASSEAVTDRSTVTQPTIERYRIENRLGAGGMGVVFAAYDPELERRVALKLLGQAGASRASRERLLREARAMARLAHPNVVTVYEVGTADHRDYVAMELVDGTSLGEWLKRARPPERAIIAAFIAAGRGLAAAHAAGIVHRDFKPHNVLRRQDGHIQVGDFGLAVGAASGDPPSPPTPPSRNTPSPLDNITETGSVLGTPAYMAPEQWQGENVGPAADQFAFCVALWEALAGDRPYDGRDADAVRAAIARGPAALDASKIPRKLRAVLKRGLEPDPARRWPHMMSLLHAIERTQRSVWLPLALAGATCAVAATIGIMLVRSSHPTCAAPVLDPDHVWPSGIVVRLIASGQLEAAEFLGRDMHAWKLERAAACKADEPARSRQLACLDGVLSQLDAVASAVAKATGPVDSTDTIDPMLCTLADPPRLQRTLSPVSRELVAFEATSAAKAEAATPAMADDFVARAKDDPCALALAALTARHAKTTEVSRRAQLAVAETAADRCGDDSIISGVALAAATDEVQAGRTDELALARLERVEPAVMRVPQADQLADLDIIRMQEAELADQLDKAIAYGDQAIAKFGERGIIRWVLGYGIYVERLRISRGDDLDGVRTRLRALRQLGIDRIGADSEHVHMIDLNLAILQFWSGDVAGTHAALERQHRQLPNAKSRHVIGRVVDAAGHPIAGATVTASFALTGDSVTAAEVFRRGDDVRHATSDARGEFVIPDAVDQGVIVAELGAQRSAPALIGDRVELVVGPTSRIEGHVELHGEDPERLGISVSDLDPKISTLYSIFAPIGRDGRFVVDGVQPGAHVHVRLFSVIGSSRQPVQRIEVAVDAPVVSGIELEANTSRRELHVVARATAGDLPSATVMIFAGNVAATNLAEIARMTGSASSGVARAMRPELVPAAAKPLMRRGDVVATIAGAPEGPATACVEPSPKDDDDDPELDRKIAAHPERVEVRCVPVAPTDTVVVVEVPPFPRF